MFQIVKLLLVLCLMGQVYNMPQDEAEAEKNNEEEEIYEEDRRPEKKIETIKLETTTEEVFIITDVPQDDIMVALNIDDGIYSTQAYRYINSQYSNGKEDERCYDDYMKCLSSQVVMNIVCGYNNRYHYGRYTFNSFCDLYFDNCIRGWRYWRLFKYGECPSYYSRR
ncbi:uncharacterized protein LOC121737775 [Aricia agestis]|uniref:uncharacterized protein LOC121737775 n=1 Tax=Aricia agestis TaxID=91739 RepID=UPI001C20336D|nr:uncharacterized protein LOC121737775 [Aricia agestis]